MEGINDQRWRVASRGGGERSEVEGIDKRWGEQPEAITVGGNRSEVEVSNSRWRGATGGGGERSKVEISDQRWRQAIRVEGEQA